MPDGIDPADYDTVVIWCETFGEFITAATYRQESSEGLGWER
jgi:hypothetical protein